MISINDTIEYSLTIAVAVLCTVIAWEVSLDLGITAVILYGLGIIVGACLKLKEGKNK
jgi:hypothetical protein